MLASCRSRSREGAWIEIAGGGNMASAPAVAPARERGLKFRWSFLGYSVQYVAPARERGLKYVQKTLKIRCVSRSREGAWIEIPNANGKFELSNVAPARERGLKFTLLLVLIFPLISRSREGAWIEIVKTVRA